MKIGEVVADRGYGSGDNLEFLEKRGTKSNIPLWSSRSGMTFFKELQAGFEVSADGKSVVCPEQHQMKHSFYEEASGRNVFTLPRATCMACPRAKTCLTEHEYKKRSKRFNLIDHYRQILETDRKSKDSVFKTKLWQRMWKMEGIFAEAKSHHGMRRARYRGRAKMQIQIYMISTVQNLKRLAACDFGWLRSILRDLVSGAFRIEKIARIFILAR